MNDHFYDNFTIAFINNDGTPGRRKFNFKQFRKEYISPALMGLSLSMAIFVLTPEVAYAYNTNQTNLARALEFGWLSSCRRIFSALSFQGYITDFLSLICGAIAGIYFRFFIKTA